MSSKRSFFSFWKKMEFLWQWSGGKSLKKRKICVWWWWEKRIFVFCFLKKVFKKKRFLSCIPTATTQVCIFAYSTLYMLCSMFVQVYLTQVYSGTGSADTLSAFLIPQYALMFVTMTVLCAYSLQLIYWFQMVVQIYLVDTLDIFLDIPFLLL